MQTHQPIRPHFPPGYVDNAKSYLPWTHVEERLTNASNYWVCTVRPDGRPHAVPKWAVWTGGKLYFDGSPQTRHARNLVENPAITIHLESGTDVVIVNGVARETGAPSSELAATLARAYAEKYKAFGYAPEPDTWNNGGLYEVTPHTVLTWTQFTENPTKFVLEEP